MYTLYTGTFVYHCEWGHVPSAHPLWRILNCKSGTGKAWCPCDDPQYVWSNPCREQKVVVFVIGHSITNTSLPWWLLHLQWMYCVVAHVLAWYMASIVCSICRSAVRTHIFARGVASKQEMFNCVGFPATYVNNLSGLWLVRLWSVELGWNSLSAVLELCSAESGQKLAAVVWNWGAGCVVLVTLWLCVQVSLPRSL